MCFFLTFGPVVAAILREISKSWSCCELDKGTDVYILFRGGDDELFKFDWWKVE